jgi:hypothetical protein
MIRAISIIVGLAIVAASAHVSILAVGGYSADHTPIVMAVAAGVAVAALAIGRAFSDRRFALGGLMIMCAVAGEAYGLLSTAERIVTLREAMQAPIAGIEAGRLRANQRLKTAEVAKLKADEAVTGKSAEKSCVANCRTLLEGAVMAAKTELDNARAELAKLPPLKSATPLADRLGVAAWALDLAQAALASIGANGLGATLLAFGAHGGRRQEHRGAEPAAVAGNQVAQVEVAARITPILRTVDDAEIVQPQPEPEAMPSAKEHAAKFISATMQRDPLGEISTEQLHAAYLAHCKAEGIKPRADAGKAMALLLRDLGLTMTGSNAIRGARLAPQYLRIERAA